jgi:transmembrane sensor
MSMSCDYSEDGWTIAEQAAAWRVTLGGQDGRRVPEFWSWVTQSPVHVREALLMGLLNRELQHVSPDMSVSHEGSVTCESSAGADPEVLGDVAGFRDAHRSWIVPVLLAASVVLVLLGSFFYLRVSNDSGVFSHTYVTEVGEERMVTLKDGSSFVLDAQSSLRVEISARERSFYLNGQAVFTVAHDPLRPFRVRTAATTIEALGTEFNVRTDDRTKVAVFDGVVRLYSDGAKSGSAASTASSAQLTAGEGVTINADGEITERRKVDRASVMAWEQRQLVFSRTPLNEIVREFNRYNQKGRMRVEGKAGSLYFGGVFDATDPGPLLLILSKNPQIILEHQGEDLVIRDRP